MAKLQDIADKLKINKSTVSRALSGSDRASPAMRRKVAKAAREMGYQVNPTARNLATGKTHVIWLLAGGMASPVERKIAEHAARILEERGYWLHILLHHYRDDTLVRILANLNHRMADGAILIPGADHETAASALRTALDADHVPVVFADRFYDDVPIDRVVIDPCAEIDGLFRACRDQGGAEGFVNLFRTHNPIAQQQHDRLQSLAVQEGCQCWESEDLSWQDTEAPLAILGGSQRPVHHYALQHAMAIAERGRLLFGVLDEWAGSPTPAEKVFVSQRDYIALAEQACSLLQGRLQGERQGSRSHILIQPLGVDAIG